MQSNRFELTGYLGAKPQARNLASGTPVANARLGQTYPYGTKGGTDKRTKRRQTRRGMSMLGPSSSRVDHRSSRRRVLCVILVIGGPIAVMLGMGMAGLRLNATPSVPTGLYSISSDPRAEFVEFCPPGP